MKRSNRPIEAAHRSGPSQAGFSREWAEWDMLPERFRNGAFHFWLRRRLSKEFLLKLIKLSYFENKAAALTAQAVVIA